MKYFLDTFILGQVIVAGSSSLLIQDTTCLKVDTVLGSRMLESLDVCQNHINMSMCHILTIF
jgi:hypothetical protein